METEKTKKGCSATTAESMTKTGGCGGSQKSHCSSSNEDDGNITGERLDAKMKEFAIGASVACNCHPCVRYHASKANELNIEPELIKQAIDVGKIVRKGAAGQMDDLLTELSKQ